jgi:adenosylcobyric acid synthase
VFAALAGTMLLLDPEGRRQVKGLLINKFRGDPVLLGDAVERLRELTFGTPCLGVDVLRHRRR